MMPIDYNSVIYINEKWILVNQENMIIYKLNENIKFNLNEISYKIIKAINGGISYYNLVEYLQIKSEEENLNKFLMLGIEKNLFTMNKSKAGYIVEKKPFTKPHLSRIFLEVTSKCNLKCLHCYVNAGTKTNQCELTSEEIMKIIEKANKLGVIQFDFTGGELFLIPGIKSILETTANLNMIMNIFTNGTLIDESICTYLNKIKQNIRTIYVSLDNCDEQEHDYFRGVNGAFKKTINSIKLLKESNINVSINIVITKNNYLKIEKITKYFKDSFNVDCRVAPILYVGRGRCLKSEGLSVNQISLALNQWISNSKTIVNIEENNSSNLVPYCGVGENMLFIKSNGEICLCPTLTSKESKEFELGNIFNDTLEDAWNKLIASKLKGVNCKYKDCNYINTCRGGCRSRAYLLNKDINDIDPIPCNFFNVL